MIGVIKTKEKRGKTLLYVVAKRQSAKRARDSMERIVSNNGLVKNFRDLAKGLSVIQTRTLMNNSETYYQGISPRRLPLKVLLRGNDQ